ncbi:hypothetical protein [Crossiella sp. CA198]|uniref:hypothetical protein n=1 Tax=Crossiella sp. CA198 TaxID=3455607 RepID=UPI003F8D36E7
MRIKRIVCAAAIPAVLLTATGLIGVSASAATENPAATAAAKLQPGEVAVRRSAYDALTQTATVELLLSEGYRFDVTSDGGLRFLGPDGRVVDQTGPALRRPGTGDAELAGKFRKIDDSHVSWTPDQGVAQFAGGFWCWTTNISKEFAKGVIVGSLGGTPGHVIGGIGGIVSGVVTSSEQC